MRLLLTVLLLLAPIAAADETIEAGPATAGTEHETYAWGNEACGGSTEYHAAYARVEVLEERFSLVASQSPGEYSCGSSASTTTSQLYVERRTGENSYAAAGAAVWDFETDSGRSCGSSVYLFAVTFQPGCTPNGERVPTVLDTLP